MKVCIVQRILPRYRIQFFENLYTELSKENIELIVVYGQEKIDTVPKSSECNAIWAHKIKNVYLEVFGKELVWQPCIKYLKNTDLVIVEQSNRLVVNYLMHWVLKFGFKLAYWGHGRNFQGEMSSLQEIFKQYLSKKVDWWFAYTQMSVDIILSIGFDENKITLVNNAIDNKVMEERVNSLKPEDLNKLKHSLGLKSDNIGIYCGGMYPNKQILFLLESCKKIKHHIPDFEVVFIGSGPDAVDVRREAAANDWMHYVGEMYGSDVVPYFMISKVLLMPGAVGLSVADSFVMNIPIFTTDVTTHGPEVAYLINGVNGVITEQNIAMYAEKVVAYFKDEDLQSKLKIGCKEQSGKITLDNMVTRFKSGILNAVK